MFLRQWFDVFLCVIRTRNGDELEYSALMRDLILNFCSEHHDLKVFEKRYEIQSLRIKIYTYTFSYIAIMKERWYDNIQVYLKALKTNIKYKYVLKTRAYNSFLVFKFLLGMVLNLVNCLN